MSGFLNYFFKRILTLIPLALGMAILVFFLLRLLPGCPAEVMLGADASEAEVAALRDDMGLGKPIYVQLGIWLGDLFQGDLGESFHYRRPVTEIIGSHIVPTLKITGFSTMIALTIGICGGIIGAVKQHTWIDRVVVVISTTGMSIPHMWFGLVMALVFGLLLGLVPIAGYESFWEGGLGSFKYLILPLVALSTAQIGILTKMVRARMLDILNQDYVLMARAKGLPESKVLIKHAFKNTLISVLTVVGMMLAALIGGAIVIENIFAIPGMGRLFMMALTRRDYLIIQGVILVITLTYLIINFVVDMIYAIIDPRVSYGAQKK